VAAVAVARAVGIVPPGARVYIGDVVEGGGGGGDGGGGDNDVAWRDADGGGGELDARTLLPPPPPPPPPSLAPPAAAAAPPFVLALTGRGFARLQARCAAGALPPRSLAAALLAVRVFARMTPELKAAAVEALARSGQYVMMVGDGANDAAALRAAHVGLALCAGADAAVSAPFTSLRADVSCVPTLLAEGRGALATSFGLFQFMALYSTIQFATALLAAFAQPPSFLSNNEYMAQDLGVVLAAALTMGATPSARALTAKRPSANLLSPASVGVAAAFIAATFAWQLAARAAVRAQPWYAPPPYDAARLAPDDEGTNSAVPETTTLFLMGCGQLVACAVVFAHGGRWKRPPLASNRLFAAWALAAAAAVAGLFAAPDALGGAAYAALSLLPLPAAWRGALAAMTLASAATYAAIAAAARAAHAAGACAAAQRAAPCAACRRQPSLHRTLARAWARKLQRWADGLPPDPAGGWAGDGDGNGGHGGGGEDALRASAKAAAGGSAGLLAAATPALVDAFAPLDVEAARG
jgi:cation-transporting ATPase 13A2